MPAVANPLTARMHSSIDDGQGVAVDLSPTVRAGSEGTGGPAVAFAQNQRDEVRQLEVAGAVSRIRRGDAKNETLLAEPLDVRRLTPRECERLQGFPDDYTLINYRRKPATDGPRYRALGNSFAVTVVRWIGRRLDAELRRAA